MSTNEVRITDQVTTKTYAEVFVNGESKGKREINGGPSVLELTKTLAREYGIRSFTVTDMTTGAPITSSAQANAPVADGAKIGIAAKDSRGSEGTDPVSQPDGDAGDEEAPVSTTTEPDPEPVEV